MANKLEKRLSSVACMVTVIIFNQKDWASKSYLKILNRLSKRVDALREVLPVYTEKEAEQIKKMVLRYANSTFSNVAHESGKFSSLLLAIIEEEQARVTVPERWQALEEMHKAVLAMHNYWDRELNKPHFYEEASEWMRKWQMV